MAVREPTLEELEEMRKKEARKDKLHQNYLRRKANGKQKEYEERIRAKKKAQIDSQKEQIRAEDREKGIYIKVNFLLGLRVGELVALKWSDWCDEKNLHIVREEIRNQTDNSYEVVEHTKTNRDRFVVVVPKAADILGKIERQGEYVFMRNGERITTVRIATVLRKFARYKGIPIKSSHKMRKTYASLLNASGVPLDFIREMLGHSNLNTTLGYIYNPLSESQTYDLIAKAL